MLLMVGLRKMLNVNLLLPWELATFKKLILSFGSRFSTSVLGSKFLQGFI